MKQMIAKVKKYLQNPDKYIHLLWASIYRPFYLRLIVPVKVWKMRKKSYITVVFVVAELGSWKTENLYVKMLKHARFHPILLVLPEISSPYAYPIVKEYLNKKGYDYHEMGNKKTIWKKFHPDIIFYQKPYTGVLPLKYNFQYNLHSLFCMVPYTFRNRKKPSSKLSSLTRFVWQLYAENETVIDELRPIYKKHIRVMINTGLPVMDILLQDRGCFANPWKTMVGNRKRVIYAPHHTIYSDVCIYATFMEYGEFMLELAKKYSLQTQWAFKPHPLLKTKLNNVWGRERTDAYYQEWAKMENAQIEEGDYMGLFKHSDAMIHDCGSFKLEYLYTGNPVMYLVRKDQENDYQNWQTSMALELHYKAMTKDDIEQFVLSVINGIDKLKANRDDFVRNNLTPPNGLSACDNIIRAILGNEDNETK